MEEVKAMSLDEIRAFVAASEALRFEGRNRREVYRWIQTTLVQQVYHSLGKKDRGVLRDYLRKMTGFSRAQVTRLIAQYVKTGEVRVAVYRRRKFPSLYTAKDIERLAELDEAHETLSGPATQKILYREYHEFGQDEYERLARISVAHLYNLRKSRTYRQRRVAYQPTRPVAVSIGERRKPDPQGQPGFLRVDSVHQGDLEGVKGVYHINAVDEVTQWQVVAAARQITEAYLLPVLEQMIAQFPFRIRGFHSDNGSEYINHRVAQLLEKLLVEQTKSRPRRSNDNALVECKNGAVIRKHMGYGHIAAEHAEAINAFYQQHFNPYLNFHRPCGVAEERINGKGKRRKMYRWYATPWEILRQLPEVARHLQPDLTIAALNEVAGVESDTACARRMQAAKRKLFAGLGQKQSA
jgi:transposase InsO family protein